ncbi:hypothetical protein LJR118_005466 [Acidovorax sp. LjRoot118]|uniref:hypothetical protein n=1 Tax=Acidovorax sp. LjRoot118 TaxID=3342256 RepID=UPI003ED01474
MKPASRHMPRIKKPSATLASRWLGYLLLAGLAGGFLWALWAHPVVVGALVALAMGGEAVSRAREKKHFARLLQTRSEESICHFARSIDCRDVDTWVVRAVYEELQACLAHHRAQFPLRVTDRLGANLQIDGDELDLSLVPDIAQRTGRDLSSTQANPFFGKVTTVGDLVNFFNAQPRWAVA